MSVSSRGSIRVSFIKFKSYRLCSVWPSTESFISLRCFWALTPCGRVHSITRPEIQTSVCVRFSCVRCGRLVGWLVIARCRHMAPTVTPLSLCAVGCGCCWGIWRTRQRTGKKTHRNRSVVWFVSVAQTWDSRLTNYVHFQWFPASHCFWCTNKGSSTIKLSSDVAVRVLGPFGLWKQWPGQWTFLFWSQER